jgi:hypothetical protein
MADVGEVDIGDKIRITSENENYNRHRNKVWTVSDIAHSVEEHRGYDEGTGGDLVSCRGLPVSLYEWEFEIVSVWSKIKSAKACKHADGIWMPSERKCYR